MSKEFDVAQMFGGRREYADTDSTRQVGARRLVALIDRLLIEGYDASSESGHLTSESGEGKVEIARHFSCELEDTDERYIAQVVDVAYSRTESKLTTGVYRVMSRWVMVEDMFAEPAMLQRNYELGLYGDDHARVAYMQIETPDVLGEYQQSGRTTESRPMLPYDRACLRTELTTLMGRLGCAPPN